MGVEPSFSACSDDPQGRSSPEMCGICPAGRPPWPEQEPWLEPATRGGSGGTRRRLHTSRRKQQGTGGRQRVPGSGGGNWQRQEQRWRLQVAAAAGIGRLGFGNPNRPRTLPCLADGLACTLAHWAGLPAHARPHGPFAARLGRNQPRFVSRK